MQGILILSFIFQISLSFSFSSTKAFNKFGYSSKVKKCLPNHSEYVSLPSLNFNERQTHFSSNLASRRSDGLVLRAGANSNTNEVELKNKEKKTQKVMIASLVVIAISIWKNESLISLFRSIDLSSLKSLMIQKLDELNNLGTGGLVIYTLLFCLWEILVGITTPVETAAGMAFGVKKGIIASAIGKIGGATAAFFLGRYLLQDYVRKKLEGNEMMDLVEQSIKDNPIGVALIWRFSFLPEFMKNFGLALLPLKRAHFITAVFLHGFPFTCLWTCIGAEAGKLARGTVLTPSKALNIMVLGVYIFGFFVSPTLVAWWIKGLRDKHGQKTTQ